MSSRNFYGVVLPKFLRAPDFFTGHAPGILCGFVLLGLANIGEYACIHTLIKYCMTQIRVCTSSYFSFKLAFSAGALIPVPVGPMYKKRGQTANAFFNI